VRWAQLFGFAGACVHGLGQLVQGKRRLHAVPGVGELHRQPVTRLLDDVALVVGQQLPVRIPRPTLQPVHERATAIPHAGAAIGQVHRHQGAFLDAGTRKAEVGGAHGLFPDAMAGAKEARSTTTGVAPLACK
jgi:hypothetical protein